MFDEQVRLEDGYGANDETVPSHRSLTAANPGPGDRSPLCLGDLTIFPASRTVLRSGKTVCIGGRAFDLLVLLLRSRGLVVAKEEINRHVWPATFVEESNLRFQVGRLRKALGSDGVLIKTVARRGYILVAEPAALEPAEREVVRSLPQPKCPVAGSGTLTSDNTQLLENFFRSAASLLMAYGSVDALIGAIGAGSSFGTNSQR